MLNTDINSLEFNNNQLFDVSNTYPSALSNPYGLAQNNGNFVGNLPTDYQLFPGDLIRANEFLTNAQGGIYGAPEPDYTPETVFGNPNSYYAWVTASTENIRYQVNKRPVDYYQPDLPPSFHIDGDDALVLFGETPPRLTHLSFTLYDTLKFSPETPLGASLDGYSYSGTSIGLNLNQNNLKTVKTAEAPFNSYFAIIVTSNTITRDKIQDSLVQSGVPTSAINSYLIPEKFANAGKTDNPEQLSFLIRYTFQSDIEKQAASEYIKGITSVTKPLEFDTSSIESYGFRQDVNSTISLQDSKKTLKIKGNGAKKIELPMTITPNTQLQFDFKSNVQGKIQGIGLDDNNLISYDKFFQLYGTESKGINQFNTYAESASDWKTYTIPVGEFFTGDVKYLTFINEEDVLNPQSESMFNDIKFFENVPEPIIKASFVKAPGIDGNVFEVPTWEDTLRPDDVGLTSYYTQKVDQLQQNVVNTYLQQGYSLNEVLTEEMEHSDPNLKRQEDKFGAYDAPDALYTYFRGGSVNSQPPVDIGSLIEFQSEDDFLIIIGADPTMMGNSDLATYWSYQSKPYLNNPETFAFTGLHTKGSALQYTNPELAEHLFAVKIKPSNEFGGGQQYTVNIPYDNVQSLSQAFGIVGRIYLDPLTTSAPNPANLIRSRILWFTQNQTLKESQDVVVSMPVFEDITNLTNSTLLPVDLPRGTKTDSRSFVLNYEDLSAKNRLKQMVDRSTEDDTVFDELTNPTPAKEILVVPSAQVAKDFSLVAFEKSSQNLTRNSISHLLPHLDLKQDEFYLPS
jgi:hypothetical protein